MIGPLEIVQFLVDCTINPNAPDEYGENPIVKATRLLGPNHDIVRILQTFQ